MYEEAQTLLFARSIITACKELNYPQHKGTSSLSSFEPLRDKTNKVSVRPAKSSEDSDQPGHPSSLIRVFAARMKKAWTLSYPLSAQRRPWSDWADAQADLSLRWAHSHIFGFVTRRLICRNRDEWLVCVLNSWSIHAILWADQRMFSYTLCLLSVFVWQMTCSLKRAKCTWCQVYWLFWFSSCPF